MRRDANQTMRALVDGAVRELHLPAKGATVVDTLRWGAFDEAFTPAFWAGQAWLQTETRRLASYRLTASLREELVVCLLGGHGIPAEVGVAAFVRLRDAGALNGTPSVLKIERLLRGPISLGARSVHYRFARQKARYVALALRRFEEVTTSQSNNHKQLRRALTALPGVGPKTASWVVRNWYDSDDVAILDVHICRACELAGVFSRGSDPARDYYALESRFLAFANALNVRASVLDNVMWQTMRRLPRTIHALLKSA